jgi:hypothetical protein
MGRCGRVAAASALAALTLSAAGVVGCALVAGLGDYVVGGDASLSPDVDADAVRSDGPQSDSALPLDASSACDGAHWCDCNTPVGGYCLDFDEEAGVFGPFIRQSNIQGDGGTLAIEPGAAVSPPNALYVEVPDITQGAEILDLRDFAIGVPRDGGVVNFHAALDLRIEQNSFALGTLFMTVGLASDQSDAPPLYEVSFVLDGTVLGVSEYHVDGDGGAPPSVAHDLVPNLTPVLRQWYRVALDVRIDGLGAGTVQLTLDDAGPQPFALAPTLVSGYPFFLFGVPFNVSGGGAVDIDNVTVVAE